VGIQSVLEDPARSEDSTWDPIAPKVTHMALIQMNKIFDSVEGVRREGAAYLIPEELEVSAFISVGREALEITRLAKIEASVDCVQFITHKGERFFFPPDVVLGVKLGAMAKRQPRASGFQAT
jgi:hypothetical protein